MQVLCDLIENTSGNHDGHLCAVPVLNVEHFENTPSRIISSIFAACIPLAVLLCPPVVVYGSSVPTCNLYR